MSAKLRGILSALQRVRTTERPENQLVGHIVPPGTFMIEEPVVGWLVRSIENSREKVKLEIMGRPSRRLKVLWPKA
ncbi:hypothetical protein N7462_009695 [Penicillium macrosclerotiorum]|uniref:uncharacterized protein n=1 Tax=Penicillium macrosclerotiorum TaxID=303699 RepID=UPI002547A262|nr:uncharacterized protein N7462_009695 [Penicillium macrosclerotiorum]KAJ5674256.1 hypothetical protein N7462_009695 [Penicillium macrosclerotiorum]